MKLPLHVLRERAPLEIQMTPMIDVVFLLLVFFVWTAGFALVEKVLPSRVSTESAAKKAPAGATPDDTPPPPEADFDRVIVRLFWKEGKPSWSINQEPVATAAAVRDHLARIGQVTTDVPVILHPEGEVPLHHVIEIYDAARQVGFAKLSLAATPQR